MTNAASSHATQAPGQLVGLITLSVLALVAAVILGINALTTAGDSYASSSDIAVAAGLSWWSGFMLTVAVVAFVGALVIAGVRRMLIGAGLDV